MNTEQTNVLISALLLCNSLQSIFISTFVVTLLRFQDFPMLIFSHQIQSMKNYGENPWKTSVNDY